MAKELPIVKRAGDLLIAADAGLTAVEAAGLRPDLILGDFDSLGRVPAGENVLRSPVKKDDTDMMLAIKRGLSLGYRAFYLFGGVGGRADHTLANLQALAYLAERSAYGYLFGPEQAFTVVKNGALCFDERCKGVFSAFAFGGEARDVTIEGLQYTLKNGSLSPADPMGVSNEFIGKKALVRVGAGRLLAVWGAENPLPERIQ